MRGRKCAMRGWICRPAALILLAVQLAICSPARAEIVLGATIANVMTGGSSSGSDQVWVRITEQLPGVSSACIHDGHPLFYVSGDSGLNGDKAMAALLGAQLSGTHVSLVYTVMATASDLWGFGITSCRIDRLAVGN